MATNLIKIQKNDFEKIFIQNFPQFEKIYEKYQRDNDNEYLPYVLIGTYLIPEYISKFLKDPIIFNKNKKLILSLFDFFEECLINGDEYIQDLVGVEIFEYIASLDPQGLHPGNMDLLIESIGPLGRKNILASLEGYIDNNYIPLKKLQ